ncbi:PRC-barrel domain-containing protein [Salipaludibacillus agaradhaerens]|uniref:PRC-barrel domain-containing protein n=1 Tax=Salipaludibacillus agaradhaerens TaxID=76935 RepID=UPI00117EA1AA|nr:PRC-barrel domain-containing protein [Salipaludibacillus agaradhaerens]
MTKLKFRERVVNMMLHYSWLSSYTIYGSDSEIGPVTNVYFDTERWTVRYFIVKTGATFLAERVFISPASIAKIDHKNNVIRLSISSKEVDKAPVPEKEPLSRQYEKDMHTYYRMSPYWVGHGIWGPAALPHELLVEDLSELPLEREHDHHQSHVYDAENVIGYKLATKNDTFGKIDDFLIDESSFEIKYYIADTKKWLPGGKKILISPKWIEEISWEKAQFSIDVTREQLEKAPEYLPELDLDDKRESELWLYYGK